MEVEPKIINSVLKALKWLLMYQNKDGSWGKTTLEKIRWTSNALLTLSELGFDSNYSPISKAVNWLNSYSTDNEEWYLKIPPLLSLGFKNEIENKGEIENLKRLIIEDNIGALSVKVALILDLKKYNIVVENLERIEYAILNTLRDEGHSLLSFSSSTNATSLYCEFLAFYAPNKHQDIIKKGINWVLIRKIINDNHSICWENSFGKTAYVTINLINIMHDKNSIFQLLKPILNYFRQDRNGAIFQDKIPALKSTSSIYTTILFIRAFASIANINPEIYKSIFYENFRYISITEIKRQKFISITRISIFSILIFMSIGGILYYAIGKDFTVSVISSLVAASLPPIVSLLKRYLN